MYRGQGAYAKAEPLYVRALTISEKALGPEHPSTGARLNNLAGLYRAQGEYAKAEPLYMRALAISEKAEGPEHPFTGARLNNLAGLYEAKGAYAKAELLFVRALAISEKALGPEHPSTGASLNNLAELYRAQGAYAKAEPLYLRALAISEKAEGPEHPSTGASLNNLAGLYRAQGAFAKAEPVFIRALAISEKAEGPEHPSTGTRLNNLAGLYEAQGAYAKAEPLYMRALAISEKAEGPEHPSTGTSLNNLAGLYRAQGAYAKAEPLFVLALAISEKTLGPEHPSSGTTLNNLAGLYLAQGAYAKAGPLYMRALAINEKTLGPEHPSTGTSVNNLAGLYLEQGAYAKAEPLFVRALAISEKTLGPEHPATITILENLTAVESARGAWASAAARLSRLSGSQRHRADLSFGRDTEKSKVLNSRRTYMSILHAGAAIPAHREEFLPILFRTVISSKARLADEMHTALESLKRRSVVEDRRRLEELEGVWQRMSALMMADASPAERNGSRPDTRRSELQELRSRESDLTALISARSADFRKLTEDPSTAKLTAALAGRPLIEIVRINRFQPKAGGQLFGDAIYAAIALFPDGRIEMHDLGEATEIDDLVNDYRRAQEVVDNSAQAEEVGGKLGAKVLAPIARMTGDSLKEWYLAPDGALRLIPIGALRVNGRYAAEQYQIWTVSSGRDLLRVDSRIESGADDLIVANPSFGPGEGGFSALPETEEEAETIREVLPNAQIVEEGNRSRKYLLDMRDAPRILHLATHAFYRRSGETGADPLLRGGIALDGANAGRERRGRGVADG